MRKKEREIWREMFGASMRVVFSFYNMTDSEFHYETKCDASTAKHWKLGDRFPNNDNFEYFSEYIRKKSTTCQSKIDYLFKEIENIFKIKKYGHIYNDIISNSKKDSELVIYILKYCIDAGKGRIMNTARNEYPSQNRVSAIVFDFDGTLTLSSDPIIKTTWENIWTSLGYDVRECQNLHKRFDKKEITHSEWCKITEEFFKERNMRKNILFNIANKITLIDGVEETFKELRKRDIKIYIVSGSIKLIIQNVLGSLNEYVDMIRANELRFNEDGYLTRIIGTKYDFEGKAEYIRIIADDLQISTKDILFVGNSRNDHFVYESGARTLCINPRLTDMMDTIIWNDCIETCTNLTEILTYLY